MKSKTKSQLWAGHADAGITMKVYAHFVGQDHTKALGELEDRYFSRGVAV